MGSIEKARPLEADVLIVGDFRFPGGTSTAIAAEIDALTEAGYRVDLLPLASDLISAWRSFHSEIVSAIAAGKVRVVPPGESAKARLCCLHHPAVFETYPSVDLQVTAEETVLITHHPPVDNFGVAQYAANEINDICSEIFGPLEWAPVGPKVRAAFERLETSPLLTRRDWVNTIDAAKYACPREASGGARPVIARHSRPNPLKWPGSREAFLQAYPDDPRMRVRLMGYDPQLDVIVGDRPDNWEVLAFNSLPVKSFLASSDYFSYFHSDAWIEAFGRAILEAMASGLVCFLPDHFASLFADGAVYCRPAEVRDRVLHFQAHPEEYARQSRRAVGVVKELFGPDQAVARVRDRIGAPHVATVPAMPLTSGQRAGVVYFTSNGIGMGHLTRSLASARRLAPETKPLIVTMSKAFGVVRDQGMMVEYLPYFASVGLDETLWHHSLAQELKEVLRFHDPKVFVFDGNVPYDGMLDALDGFPALWKIWQRRGMWRPGAGQRHIECEPHFDAVIEPGELAAAMDRGLTQDHRDRTILVPPIRYLEENEALPREAARAVMGLDPDAPAVLLLLGSGNNFKTHDIQSLVLNQIRADDPGRTCQIAVGRWRISEDPSELPEGVIPVTTFPFARFLSAFDYSVALAGYNTFHENIAAGLPTLFLSNENPNQDEQWLRAEYGALRGLCLSARGNDPYAISRNLVRLAKRKVQKAIRRKCLDLVQSNGADQVAQYLSHLALTRKSHAVARWARSAR